MEQHSIPAFLVKGLDSLSAAAYRSAGYNAVPAALAVVESIVQLSGAAKFWGKPSGRVWLRCAALVAFPNVAIAADFSFVSSHIFALAAHVAAFLDTWLASFLITGSISYLYYANRLFQLPLALFAIATSVALFPTIAKSIKNKDEEKALAYLRKAFYVLLGLLGISTIIGIVLNTFIVELLFQRGAFTSEDTETTSLVLTMYLVGLLPFGLGKIFSLWFTLMKNKLLLQK